MGLVLVIIGLLMVVTGARGTYAQFGSQVASEFTAQPGGGPSFTTWLLAISAVGALGYIPTLQVISRWLMALVVLSLFLSHKGFFAKLTQSLNTAPVAPEAGAVTNASGNLEQATGSSAMGQAATALGATTINKWLQSIPGIGSVFAPSPAPQ